ncbi:hypothetical protein MMC19_004233 [Ptychographa xylographoides]|nr:hypothetical protein [Ptychographa xylographoides]
MKTRSIKATGSLPATPMVLSEDSVPPRLLVLPKPISSNIQSSICTLAHPRTLQPTRYFVCPELGVYEFTRVAAPNSSFRSCLLGTSRAPRETHDVLEKEEEDGKEAPSQIMDQEDNKKDQDRTDNGYVSKTAEILTATPIDLLFLVLPVLCPESASTKSTRPTTLFLSSEALFEDLVKISKHFDHVLGYPAIRQRILLRMEAVCDTVVADDERMYRLNEGKLLGVLCSKARRMAGTPLPKSMEEKFVKRALEAPVTTVMRQNTAERGLLLEEQTNREDLPALEVSQTLEVATESQSSVGSSASSRNSVGSDLTTVTTPDEPAKADASPEIVELQRIRVALTYLMSTYVPSQLAAPLHAILASGSSPIDFGPCDEYLAHIARHRADVQASRSLADFSRKRTMHEDDEASESRAEKKRKTDADEKRKKAGESRGVRDLKKVNTVGMRKMSDFFACKGPQAGAPGAKAP